MENQKKTSQKIPVSDKKKPFRKKTITLAAVIAVLSVAAFLTVFFVHRNSHTPDTGSMPSDANPGNMPGGQPGDIKITENTVTASGTVNVGIINETFDIDYLETELEIEEVYLTSNTDVKKGEKIAKLTEESVEKARDELTDACTEAELACRAGIITCEQAKIEAQYEYDTSLLSGRQAQEVYDETLAQLQEAVDNAQKDIDEANEDIAEYTDAVQNNSYDEKYQVSYLKQKYEQDLELLMDKMEEWELPWPYVTGQDDDGNPVNAPGNLPNLNTAKTLYQEVDEEAKEYGQAKENYDTALADANYRLQELQLEMASLEGALLTAKNNYNEGVISAKAAYDTAITKQKNAKSVYDTAIKKAQEESDALQDEKNDAEERLEEFEARIGDGYLYTTGSGNILMVMLEEGNILSGNSMILAYSNTDELSVLVSVGQDAIHKISVGEDASVIVSDYGTFQGKVQSINPVSQSSSRSLVTYLVTVKLEGDVSMLSANLSAQVIFGMEGETDENNEK